MKVKVAVLGSPFLIVRTVSVDVKQQYNTEQRWYKERVTHEQFELAIVLEGLYCS